MKPLLIFGIGFFALWAIQRSRDVQLAQGAILPQTQRGIASFPPVYTPQQPQYVYSGIVQPPGSATPGGYVPAFGPYWGNVDPNVLYWNQA